MYDELANQFSSFLEESTSNYTEEDDSSENDTNVYKIAVSSYYINPYASDS